MDQYGPQTTFLLPYPAILPLIAADEYLLTGTHWAMRKSNRATPDDSKNTLLFIGHYPEHAVVENRLGSVLERNLTALECSLLTN